MDNKVKFEGSATNVVMYKAKEQNRCEIQLTHHGDHGAVSMTVQVRGILADKLFMEYQKGRTFSVEGRLKARRYGKIIIVADRILLGEKKEDATPEERIAEKVDAWTTAKDIVDALDNTAESQQKNLFPDAEMKKVDEWVTPSFS